MSPEPTNPTRVGGLLERSAQLAALEEHLAAVRAQGRGRLVLIGGEAGIGKTTLVRAFYAEQRSIRLLWGACDALYTPRPLGPFADMAQEAGGELGAVIEEGATPAVLVTALAGELGRRSASVVVLEDLHWADEATLDVVRLLARRIESVAVLVLATYRDDALDRAHPLRIVLGELPRHTTDRIALPPLSPGAVAALAGSAGVDHGELHRRTAGNPFFVTEVLATADD
ncbi:MAG: AAA family ATPase, partial [Solirubrobacteraceae bacterium]